MAQFTSYPPGTPCPVDQASVLDARRLVSGADRTGAASAVVEMHAG